MFTLLRGLNQQVQFVDRRNNNLKEVPDEILALKAVEELLLDSNHIKLLPKGLFRLPKIQKLTLSENEIFKLQPEIGNITTLVEFDISKNDIYDIPENIKSLKQLQIADFSSNPLKKVPYSIVYLQNLMDLKLNDVNLTELPSDFGRLTNLKNLELRDNMLKQLPSSFVSLKNLECVDLASNMFEEMPSCLCQLPNLKELWLDSNEITSLLSDIKKMKNLRCFDISENDLEFLPEEIAGMEKLTDFYVSQNYLQLLPNGIGNLTELTVFKVDSNRLLSLPLSLGKCKNLQELVLKENEISSFPETVGSLLNLKTLIADCNKLSTLPSGICNLSQLSVLSLRDNCLYYMPEEIGSLKKLQVLDLCGNRIQFLPVSITLLNLKALWLSENQHQPLLKFQRDLDWKTNREIITCYMLPQQENITDYSAEYNDKPYSNSQRIQFKVDSEEDLDKEAKLIRHTTPYPKDLKPKIIKLLPVKNKALKAEDLEETDSHKPSIWKTNEDNIHLHSISPVIDSGVSSAASPVNTTSDKIEYNYLSQTNGVVSYDDEKKMKSANSTDQSLDELEENSSENGIFLGKDNISVDSKTAMDFHPHSLKSFTHELLNIFVQREPSGLGLSIAGGKESTPYKGEDEGIFVSKVTKGRPSDKAGLRVEDKILKVNDIPMLDVDHFTAVQILRNAGNIIKFTILRELPLLTNHKLTPSASSTSNSHICDDIHEVATIQPNDIDSRNASVPSCTNLRTVHSGMMNNNAHINYRLLNASPSNNESHCSVSKQIAASVPNTVTDSNKTHSFDPDMASTPVNLSGTCCKGVPKIDNYDGPVVKVTIQNSRPYVPLSPDLPPTTKALGETSEILTRSSYSETTLTRITNNQFSSKSALIEEVVVPRHNGSLGLSIMGGCDQTCFPFGNGRPGIFVSRVAKMGTAAKTKKIRVGDRILKVNNVDLTHSTHSEAVSALCASIEEVNITIQHDPLPGGWQEINFESSKDDVLGVEVDGGIGGHANPFDYYDEGIFITKILPNSSAECDGRLMVGMRVIEVCNVSFLGASLYDAKRVLSSHAADVSFIVCTGFNTSSLSDAFKNSPSCNSMAANMDSSSVKNESVEIYNPAGQELDIANGRSVDAKVLDVVRAAEQLVLPSSRLYPIPSSTLKKKKTTTIVLSKHEVLPPPTESENSKQTYLPCEV